MRESRMLCHVRIGLDLECLSLQSYRTSVQELCLMYLLVKESVAEGRVIGAIGSFP